MAGLRNSLLARIGRVVAPAIMLAAAISVPSRAEAGDRHVDEIAALTYIDSLPKPPVFEGIGQSHLPITTTSEEAQRYFDQGLNLLHCFWDFEALRAFRQVVRLDPNAAMGYWGLHRALEFGESGAPEDYAALAEAATALSNKVSEHEQYYIRSISFRQKGDSKGFRAELEAMASRYPNDVDAQLFLALSLWSGYTKDERPREGQNYGLTLLRYLLKTHPDHPAVHHYWIHLTEMTPQFPECLPSAREICGLAPASGHILHMAGHVHFHNGDYANARQVFVQAMDADQKYMDEYGIRPIDTWNYIHNLDFLVSNCAEEGRYADGERWAQVLQKLEVPSAPEDSSAPHFVSTRGRVRLMRGKFALPEFYLRFGDWAKAVAAVETLQDDPALSEADAQLYLGQLGRFAGAMQALEERRVDDAAGLADAFDAEMWRSRRDQTGAASQLAELSILEALSLELRGNVLNATGDRDAAVAMLNRAAEARGQDGGDPPFYPRPVQESLAAVHRAAGNWAAARAAYLDVLKLRPHSGHALFGIALCYENEGDEEASAKGYEEFLNAWRNADPARPNVRHAQDWLRKRVR